MASTTSPLPTFLTLPLEIRNNVYANLFTTSTPKSLFTAPITRSYAFKKNDLQNYYIDSAIRFAVFPVQIPPPAQESPDGPKKKLDYQPGDDNDFCFDDHCACPNSQCYPIPHRHALCPRAENAEHHPVHQQGRHHLPTAQLKPEEMNKNLLWLLGVSRQVRSEVLEEFAYLFSTRDAGMGVAGKTTQASSAAPATVINRSAEQVTVELEVNVFKLTNLGGLTPARTRMSPTFIAMAPLFDRVRSLKLEVTTGVHWWISGLRRKGNLTKRQKLALLKQENEARAAAVEIGSSSSTAGAQQQQQQQQQQQHSSSSASSISQPRPEPQKPQDQDTPKLDDLSIALSTLLPHFPSLTFLDISIHIKAFDYWNWDLPSPRHSGVTHFITHRLTTRPENPHLKRVRKQFVIVDADIVFFAREEKFVVGGIKDGQGDREGLFNQSKKAAAAADVLEGMVEIREDVATNLEEDEYFPTEIDYRTDSWTEPVRIVY